MPCPQRGQAEVLRTTPSLKPLCLLHLDATAVALHTRFVAVVLEVAKCCHVVSFNHAHLGTLNVVELQAILQILGLVFWLLYFISMLHRDQRPISLMCDIRLINYNCQHAAQR